MNTVDDLVFKVKGKSVNAPMSDIKALPEEERRKAYARLRALGSAVAGFTGAPAKMPPTVAAMGGAGAAPRSRSRSPTPPGLREEIKSAMTKALSKYSPAERKEILSGFGSSAPAPKKAAPAPEKSPHDAAFARMAEFHNIREEARDIIDGVMPFPRSKAKAIKVRDANRLRPLLKASGIVRSDADIERFADRLMPLVLRTGILLWRTPKGNLRAEPISK